MLQFSLQFCVLSMEKSMRCMHCQELKKHGFILNISIPYASAFLFLIYYTLRYIMYSSSLKILFVKYRKS